jgi:hypothetical protein
MASREWIGSLDGDQRSSRRFMPTAMKRSTCANLPKVWALDNLENRCQKTAPTVPDRGI